MFPPFLIIQIAIGIEIEFRKTPDQIGFDSDPDFDWGIPRHLQGLLLPHASSRSKARTQSLPEDVTMRLLALCL